jgi:hypothetical protein
VQNYFDRRYSSSKVDPNVNASISKNLKGLAKLGDQIKKEQMDEVVKYPTPTLEV